MSTVLVIGSGGREHALAWKISQSPQVSRLIVAPGNSGMPSEWERWFVHLAEGKSAFEELADRAKQERVDLAVVGPDNPLADGIVDVFLEKGVPVFGPRAAAARIEASKSFAKEVMGAAGVPTAKYWVAHSAEDARKILKSVPWSPSQAASKGWVIKADGLALGKGVRVCSTFDEALLAVQELIRISNSLVIEERLAGEELSWMGICDGERVALLDPARDYKRLNNQDQGPNTGGMGAFSPVPGIPAAFSERIREEVFIPTLKELKRRNSEFRGLLYAGLMVDSKSKKFWVLEFNARFGDPETQVVLPRMEEDLVPWLAAAARGKLADFPPSVKFKKETAVFVVAAAQGYPEHPVTGQKIDGPGENIFYSGVRLQGEDLVTAGGRVLGTLGMGDHLEEARQKAYARLEKIHFQGMHFRTDVGQLEQG